MKREEFINTILKSVDGITKVSPSETVYLRIEKEINYNKVPTKSFWLVAASIVVLLSVNLALLNGKSNSNGSDLANFENSINKSNQLYK
ncbi:MAG: hypothetical protein ACJAQ1_001132 [Flavobacterium sp.]|jgi:hypothetical protein